MPPACCSTPRVVPRHVLPLLLESEGRFPALLLLVDNYDKRAASLPSCSTSMGVRHDYCEGTGEWGAWRVAAHREELRDRQAAAHREERATPAVHREEEKGRSRRSAEPSRDVGRTDLGKVGGGGAG